MDDLERLKELAEKATPGPWFVGIADEPRRGPVDAEYKAPGYYDNIGVISSTSGGTAVGCNEYNVFSDLGTATYIAAANPEVVLKIIARVRELEAKLLEESARADDNYRSFDRVREKYSKSVQTQRTPGTVEVCTTCDESRGQEALVDWRECPQPKCPIKRSGIHSP